jgi:hypothetical protein
MLRLSLFTAWRHIVEYRYSFTHCYSSREMELNAHNLDPAVLTTWKEPRVPVMHETGRFGEEKKSLPFQGNRTTIPRLPSLQCSQCRDCTVLENFDTPFMFYIILTLVLQFWYNSTELIFMLCHRLSLESFYWCPLSFLLLEILIPQYVVRCLLDKIKR